MSPLQSKKPLRYNTGYMRIVWRKLLVCYFSSFNVFFDLLGLTGLLKLLPRNVTFFSWFLLLSISNWQLMLIIWSSDTLTSFNEHIYFILSEISFSLSFFKYVITSLTKYLCSCLFGNYHLSTPAHTSCHFVITKLRFISGGTCGMDCNSGRPLMVTDTNIMWIVVFIS